ncbi:DUF4389 domain-containing protein [Parasporobacterium paucivorans]|uniref:DUF4389 domain-containing protein n=1 Tax=Parasporobacterium paucivorans DSM 15970 TaxID=1122934 RepID=A0A1M6CXA4_9FIRM|nr:DUF4389 domain-containing protein [Parasporobacterium paucivorans]SHI65616.1 protein of unknown function [Parasporobacterium paucivorans DSM 15970]
MEENTATYPVKLSIEYPERQLDRMTSFFRLFTVIPIAIILGLVVGGNGGDSNAGQEAWHYTFSAGGVLALPTLLMILFRQKYPKWWFDFNLELTKFSIRVCSYICLLTDVYPSTDEEQSVHISVPYPDAKNDLNRGLPLVKWFLAIPHYFILFFLWIAAGICVVIAWFAIIFTGRYPRSLFDFIVGVIRWSLRVSAYAALLVTDQYPPFQFE